ncbi:class A sortase [Atopobacter phocae]|uniref:class A sortase n=1 Tax=Atopobacter phocae TaxID=136492 RepID=UPI000471F7FE|nr:class A sortase [Atopobacter phocae]
MQPRNQKYRKSTKKWTIRRVMRILSISLIVFGVLLLLTQPLKNYFVSKWTTENQIVNVTKDDIKRNMDTEGNFDFEQVKNVDLNDVVKNALNNRGNLPVIGGIAVPSVKLNLPIYKGVAHQQLLSGAGTLRPDQVMGSGNYPLASHRMIDESLLFTPLIHVNMGDLIYLTDLEHVYVYKTTFIQTVEPTRVDLAYDDPDGVARVTLITCNPTGSMREIVRGEFVKKVAMSDASDEMIKAFELKSNNNF